MDKGELLHRISDIEWEDFEVKDASGGFSRSVNELIENQEHTEKGEITEKGPEKGTIKGA
jgi:hypothetical protein